MFKLFIEEKLSKEYKQFTLTIDKNRGEEIINLAKKNNMKTHRFIKSVLLGYLEFVKNEEMINIT